MDEPKKSKRLIIWNGGNMYFVLLAMFVVGKEWEAKIYSEIFVLKHVSFLVRLHRSVREDSKTI